MSTATDRSTASVQGGGRAVTPLVAAFAVTQTVGYGVLSYAFSVLLAPIAADLGVPISAVTAAFTLSVLVAAPAAVPVGRWLDRHGGRALMTAGSVLGVAAVVAWSQVRELWQLYAVFAAIGIAASASLYEAAFAVLISVTDPARRDKALLAVTIVAGFASSIFFPLTGWLLAHHGWRTTLVVLAAILGAATIPGHLLMVPSRRSHHQTATRRTGAGIRDAVRESRFWLTAAAFVVQGAATSAVSVLLIAYLLRAGHSAAVAATISGLLGVLSVTGRVVTTGLARRFGMVSVTAGIFAVQAAGALALQRFGGTPAYAAVCVVAFGIGFGVATIARPAILAAAYGTRRYATIAGAMNLPIIVAKAVAPSLAAVAGVGRFLPYAAGACLIAAVLLAVTAAANSTPAN